MKKLKTFVAVLLVAFSLVLPTKHADAIEYCSASSAITCDFGHAYVRGRDLTGVVQLFGHDGSSPFGVTVYAYSDTIVGSNWVYNGGCPPGNSCTNYFTIAGIAYGHSYQISGYFTYNNSTYYAASSQVIYV